jgi:uncharacterized protein (DUF2267 family)
MNKEELVSAVRSTAGIDTVEHGEAAIRATLRVLGQRLSGGETKDLAAQLPPAFTDTLPATGPGERFGVDEFYGKVAEDEGLGCSKEQARQHARAVLAALKASVTGGEFDDVVAQLPDKYADLLGTGPVQH